MILNRTPRCGVVNYEGSRVGERTKVEASNTEGGGHDAQENLTAEQYQ